LLHTSESQFVLAAFTCDNAAITTNPSLIRVIPQEESIEVRLSTYLYFDDNPDRRSINGRLSREQAEATARAERDKLGQA